MNCEKKYLVIDEHIHNKLTKLNVPKNIFETLQNYLVKINPLRYTSVDFTDASCCFLLNNPPKNECWYCTDFPLFCSLSGREHVLADVD